MDPRDTFTAVDWVVASAFFLMWEAYPPGKDYIAFYNYAHTHKPLTLKRIQRTVRRVARFKKMDTKAALAANQQN